MKPSAFPGTEAEAAEFIRAACEERRTVAIEGGGSKSAIGTVEGADSTLSTRLLCGITAYRPEELVITAKAGTPVAEIAHALAEKGQHLPFEPMDHRELLHSAGEPTIGAVAAINNSGPRRIVAGAARDSLLGVRFINGRGEIIRAGGRVMKNVTGLDLVKLLAGSWGSLGLLSEVTFKVLPSAADEVTLALGGLDDAEATRVMAHAMASSVGVSGAAHLPELVGRRILGTGAATLLRIEGFAESVSERAARLATLLDGIAPIEMLPLPRSRQTWQAVVQVSAYAADPHKPIWRVSMLPSKAHAFIMDLRMEIGADAYYDWQGGLVWIQIETGGGGVEVREALARHGGGNAMLVRADSEIRRSIPAAQPLTPALAKLTQRVRKALDPAGVFISRQFAAN